VSGIPFWAVPGAKVVCISAPLRSRKFSTPPEVGAQYTIRETFISSHGTSAARLVEIKGTYSRKSKMERGWKLFRFRPLITRSQDDDMAIFRPILDQLLVDA
jgi:hypothetical protein